MKYFEQKWEYKSFKKIIRILNRVLDVNNIMHKTGDNKRCTISFN